MKRLAALLALLIVPVLLLAQGVNPYAPTYQTFPPLITLAASPTDAMCVEGSASKVTRITHLTITCGGTFTAPFDIVKRSTLNTGGTSTSTAPIPRDSTDPASPTNIRTYTANPASLGTLVGSIEHRAVTCPGTVADFDWSIGKPVTLNGAAEAICVNLGGSATWTSTMGTIVTLQNGG